MAKWTMEEGTRIQSVELGEYRYFDTTCSRCKADARLVARLVEPGEEPIAQRLISVHLCWGCTPQLILMFIGDWMMHRKQQPSFSFPIREKKQNCSCCTGDQCGI